MVQEASETLDSRELNDNRGAVILAGGKGTRLSPITDFVHKSLIPIRGKPLIWRILLRLAAEDFRRAILCISDNKFKQQFLHSIGSGERFGIEVSYSIAAETTGTAGRLALAGKSLGQRFLVHYGDIVTDLPLKRLFEFHRRSGAICTIAVTDSIPLELGIVKVGRDKQVRDFLEKPRVNELGAYANIGVLACDRMMLSYCRRYDDLSADTIPRLLRDGRKVMAFPHRGRFADVGSFAALQRLL